jgi:hypothetical protein
MAPTGVGTGSMITSNTLDGAGLGGDGIDLGRSLDGNTSGNRVTNFLAPGSNWIWPRQPILENVVRGNSFESMCTAAATREGERRGHIFLTAPDRGVLRRPGSSALSGEDPPGPGPGGEPPACLRRSPSFSGLHRDIEGRFAVPHATCRRVRVVVASDQPPRAGGAALQPIDFGGSRRQLHRRLSTALSGWAGEFGQRPVQGPVAPRRRNRMGRDTETGRMRCRPN